jgi:hypothetical protein
MKAALLRIGLEKRPEATETVVRRARLRVTPICRELTERPGSPPRGRRQSERPPVIGAKNASGRNIRAAEQSVLNSQAEGMTAHETFTDTHENP